MHAFLNTTITSSVTALIILLVKKLLSNKISLKWQLYIWIILALRLIVPVFPQSTLSVFNSIPSVQNIEISEKALESIPSETNTFVTGKIVFGNKDKAFTLYKSFADYITTIWLGGAAVMFIYMSCAYLVFSRKTKGYPIINDEKILSVLEECKVRAGVIKSIKVRNGGNTPLLKGIFKPEIILPGGYTEAELKSVFTHEMMHLKHGDVALSMFCTLLLCTYWYNPLMWLCLFIVRRDMELLCDFRVLEVLQNRKEYATVLLKTALRKNKFIFATTSLQNGEKEISRRIKYIAYLKRPKVIWSALAALAVIVVGALCLTNALDGTSKEVNGYNAATLYKYKTKYVGDVSKVGGLTSNLPYTQYKNGISLQTQAEPYGITVNYTLTPDNFSQIVSNGKAKVIQNAAVIFCLVDNVSIIRFKFDDGSSIHTYAFERKGLSDAFGHDFREYSASLAKFEDEFLLLLSGFDRDTASSYNTPVSIDKNVELYVWRNKKVTGSNNVYYTLLPGTNTKKTNEMIYNLKDATTDLNAINEKLKEYEGDTHLSIRHDMSFTKKEMLKMDEKIEFPGVSRSIGTFGEPEESDIAAIVEKNLEIIMSSPIEDSNPWSYIENHPNEYETILKMGDNALNYMLSQFAKGKENGLKGQIMMSLCKDILGDRNNVAEGSYSSPMEWYQKLAPYTAAKLTEFKPQTEDEIEKLVYSAALKEYRSDTASLDVVAPHIFDTYEKDNILKIFATVYYSSFNLYGSSLSQGSAGVVPAAIVYTKNSHGTYTFKEYIEAKDGAYFQKSIEEFCAPKTDVAKAIMKHYGDYGDLMELMKKNVIECLKQNNLTGVSLKNYNGELTPLN